jgi:hypothetical protein
MDDDTLAAPDSTKPAPSLSEQAWAKKEPPDIAPYHEDAPECPRRRPSIR